MKKKRVALYVEEAVYNKAKDYLEDRGKRISPYVNVVLSEFVKNVEKGEKKMNDYEVEAYEVKPGWCVLTCPCEFQFVVLTTWADDSSRGGRFDVYCPDCGNTFLSPQYVRPYPDKDFQVSVAHVQVPLADHLTS